MVAIIYVTLPNFLFTIKLSLLGVFDLSMHKSPVWVLVSLQPSHQQYVVISGYWSSVAATRQLQVLQMLNVHNSGNVFNLCWR